MNIRVFGPPGTGKTFALTRIMFHLIGEADASDYLSQYDLYLPHDAYRIGDIIYMSYTNSAVDELLGRLGIRRDYRRGLWATMHGIIQHLLIKKRKIPTDVIHNTLSRPGGPNWWKRKFASDMGLPYDPTGEKMNLPGNRFFSDYTKYVNIYYPKYYDLGRVLDKLSEETEYGYYGQEWVKFKADNKVIDFDDILMLGLRTELKVMQPVIISDEFQDFSPLQWEIFQNWMEDKDYVIVAGDDEQVLFSFHGATPRFILYDYPADQTAVLKKSFRLPARILAVSRLLTETYLKHRYPKKFEPRKPGGHVLLRDLPLSKVPTYAYELAKRGKTVLILARTNSQVASIEEMFMVRNVPYYRFKTKKVTIWADFVDKIVDFVVALKGRMPVSVSEARFYLRFTGIPASKIDVIAHLIADPLKRPLDAYRIAQNPLAFIKYDKVHEYFGSDRIARFAMNSLRFALANNTRNLPGKIYIDTIHSAKGREGDVVFVIDGISNRIYDEIYVDEDAYEAEIRVWYVAMTRAKETLVITPLDNEFLRPHILRAMNRLKAKKVMPNGNRSKGGGKGS